MNPMHGILALSLGSATPGRRTTCIGRIVILEDCSRAAIVLKYPCLLDPMAEWTKPHCSKMSSQRSLKIDGDYQDPNE